MEGTGDICCTVHVLTPANNILVYCKSSLEGEIPKYFIRNVEM
jgi:hypothetical protein